jgi:hypothetical protein
MLPEGLAYLDSWVEPNFDRCFQLMECDDLRLIQQWVLNWHGSGVAIEIVPVVPSMDTVEVVGPCLDKGSALLTLAFGFRAAPRAVSRPRSGAASSCDRPGLDQTSICFRSGL